MVREVRRVPANWQHPKISKPDYRIGQMVESYQPMFDLPFGPAMREWYEEWQKWDRGERPDYAGEDTATMPYWEWDGGPPDPAYYRPDWTDAERTHLMMYETTSEGTPISPVFATPEELAKWLFDNDASAFAGQTASYESWLRVAKGDYACSAVIEPGTGMTSGVEGLTERP